MNLNAKQKASWANIQNIFNVMVSIRTPEDVIRTEMGKWIDEFQAQTPDAKVMITLGDKPVIEILDKSRSSAKVKRDYQQNLVLRAQLYRTRIAVTIANRDNEGRTNQALSLALRDLADLIDRAPYQLSQEEESDLLASLGMTSVGGDQDDDLPSPTPVGGEDSALVADAVAEVSHASPVAVAEVAEVSHSSPVAAPHSDDVLDGLDGDVIRLQSTEHQD